METQDQYIERPRGRANMTNRVGHKFDADSGRAAAQQRWEEYRHEAEQAIITLILMCYFFCMAYFSARENPLSFFRKRIFFGQSLSSGIGGILSSFAYSFGLASIITAASRSFEIFWAIISGKKYFHEKSTTIKFFSMGFIILGLFLLAYSA